MGFTDEEAIAKALAQSKGSAYRAATILLDKADAETPNIDMKA